MKGEDMFEYPDVRGRFENARNGFAVVDLETTGFDPDTDRIIEIGIVRLDAGGRFLGACETLVDPGTGEAGPSDIHGITAAQLSGAPPFAEIAGSVLAWLEGVVLVAHNAGFEEAFLSAEFRRTGWEPPATPALDTLALSRSLLPLTDHRLGTLCAWTGVGLTEAHTALGDARATAEALPHLLRSLPGPLRWDVPLPVYGTTVSGRYQPRGGTLER